MRHPPNAGCRLECALSWRSLRIVFAVLLAPCVVACQAARPPALGAVDGRLIALGTDTMDITEIEGGQERAAGEAISTVRELPGGQLELVYEVLNSDGARGAVVRTRLTRADLLPIEEVHDFAGGELITLRYTPAGVITERRGRGGRVVPTRPDPQGRGAYSSAVIDLVLRALPLTAGFRAELPVYMMGLGRRVSLPVRVTGEEGVSTRSGRVVDCWRVEADFPGPGPATAQMWIAKDSRELVRVLSHEGPNTLQRYER